METARARAIQVAVQRLRRSWEPVTRRKLLLEVALGSGTCYVFLGPCYVYSLELEEPWDTYQAVHTS